MTMPLHHASSNEEWRPVPGHKDYEASSLGRVRSVERWITRSDGRRRFWPSVILRPTKQGNYLKVALGANNTMAVHIVVCSAFHGRRPAEKHSVAHWNGDCHDNRAANLRWATVAENHADKARHGTSSAGSRNGFAKFTEADIRTIRALRADGTSIKSLSERFATHRVNISRIVHRVIWQHVR
jgi:hypothetical protein